MLTFVIALVLSYLYHGYGITAGYHRLLTHRSFKCPQWLEYLIVSGGYLAFEGSPIAWVCTHRVHHRYTDKMGDPHRPADGFWHSFHMWLIKPKVNFTAEQIEQVCPDLCRDKVYRALDFNHTRKHALVCLYACIAFRVILFFAFGPWVVLANLIGASTVFIGPFLVNSVAHLPNHGYKNFATEDDSRNVWWVGAIALGEGWHNNHHAVPQSARHGLRLSEIDITWVFISFLRAVGLASNVRIPKEPKMYPCIDPAFAKRYNRLYTENATINGGDAFDDSDIVAAQPEPVEAARPEPAEAVSSRR